MKPVLFATSATAEVLGKARAAVILIGSYDGSGNYGDIAQFDAALELVARLGPEVVVLPVLERDYLPNHLQLTSESGVTDSLALFFQGNGEPEDGLVPVGAPGQLAFGACYLYGGGYLNGSWGARKLAMLDAAENLLAAGGAGPPLHVASGLQVEPEWIESCAPTLSRFDLLGARDRRSQAALAAVGNGATVIEAGDDAIGVLGRLPASNRSSVDEESLRLNLHFAEHEWMGRDPDTVLDFYARFVAELSQLAGRPVSIQPLIAYLDGRIDERPASERLCHTCVELGAEVAEPLILRPTGLAEMAPQLGEATMTLSCSYHVAMTSLMLEVPALLIGDNAYYEQKAAGLVEDFELPPAFTATSAADPTATAAAIFPMLFEAKGRLELRGGLASGASRLRRRRAATETELLDRLGGGALTAFGGQVEELAERLRQRSAEPAALQAQVSELQTELEEQRRLAVESPLDAELRVQEAEARADEAQATLATALGSRSWRMTASLRRAGSLLRRR